LTLPSVFDKFATKKDPYFFIPVSTFRGYKRFFRRTALETSDFLKDDCLKINCTVGVVVSTMDYSRPHSIEVPESDIGYHFGTLLDTQEGVDVIFRVAGEEFHAHKLVLAARSSFFRSEFFDHESDEEKNEADVWNEIKEIVIDDMDPKVFRVCFYFCAVSYPISLLNKLWDFVFICANILCCRLCFILSTGTILLMMMSYLHQAPTAPSLIL